MDSSHTRLKLVFVASPLSTQHKGKSKYGLARNRDNVSGVESHKSHVMSLIVRYAPHEIIDLRKLCRLGFSVELALIEMTLDRLFKILDKVVHWTTPYPVDSYPVDTIGCSKA